MNRPILKNIAKASESEKVRVASEEMIKTPLWLIKQILLKHETSVIEVMKELHDELRAIKSAVKRVHGAKGLHHSHLSLCDLYALCELPNERPTK